MDTIEKVEAIKKQLTKARRYVKSLSTKYVFIDYVIGHFNSSSGNRERKDIFYEIGDDAEYRTEFGAAIRDAYIAIDLVNANIFIGRFYCNVYEKSICYFSILHSYGLHANDSLAKVTLDIYKNAIHRSLDKYLLYLFIKHSKLQIQLNLLRSTVTKVNQIKTYSRSPDNFIPMYYTYAIMYSFSS